MSVCWLVDELLSERAYKTGYPSIADVAKELGHRVYKTKYKPFTDKMYFEDGVPFEQGACVITHGTVQFCKSIERSEYAKWWTPGMYFNAHVKSFSKFAAHFAHYDKRDLLNEDYVILPFEEVLWRRSLDKMPKEFFIKPESGMKEFTGQVVGKQMLTTDIRKELCSHGIIDATTLCVVSSVKSIKAEFRYVIVDKKVVTGSEYRWDNALDVRRDTHPICDAMAKKVAEADWQADTVYVCDVALLENDIAKVVELNAFSSSGLYACDTYKVVEAVSVAAKKENSEHE